LTLLLQRLDLHDTMRERVQNADIWAQPGG
jgi:hypothetical protein